MASWFSELTSKAEAMLIKLDQDAAQALQRQDKLQAGTQQPDDDGNDASSSNLTGVKVDTGLLVGEGNVEHCQDQEHITAKDVGEQYELKPQLYESSFVSSSSKPTDKDKIQKDLLLESYREVDQEEESKPLESVHGKDQTYRESSQLTDKERKTPRQFKIQTSSNSSSLFRSSNFNAGQRSSSGLSQVLSNDVTNSTKVQQPKEYFEADDIRASINRSLQEYVTQSEPTITIAHSNVDPEISSTSQHFDNHPLLVKHSSKNPRGVSSSSPLKNSSSFSIQVPEDVSTPDTIDVTTKLLKQHTVSRKKSPMYIHRVLNSLAGIDNNPESLISDQTRLKLRRVKLRAASYARRLNYYFRVYPKLKYVVLGYILLMQLLVVYVLFFYQSAGLATELSSQVRQQQQELTKSGVDGNQVPGRDQAKLARQLV